MATTKIWDVRGRLDHVIDYAQNADKTGNPDWEQSGTMLDVMQDAMTDAKERGLIDALEYAMNDCKTEKRFYVSGINCNPNIARKQMQLAKEQWGKPGGIVAYHGYQSFAPGEVTPELAHKIGVELAQRLWGDRFQVVVATHLNTNCCHNHFVLNSVSFTDGKLYYDQKGTYMLMRRTSDELCASTIFLSSMRRTTVASTMPNGRRRTKTSPHGAALSAWMWIGRS